MQIYIYKEFEIFLLYNKSNVYDLCQPMLNKIRKMYNRKVKRKLFFKLKFRIISLSLTQVLTKIQSVNYLNSLSLSMMEMKFCIFCKFLPYLLIHQNIVSGSKRRITLNISYFFPMRTQYYNFIEKRFIEVFKYSILWNVT